MFSFAVFLILVSLTSFFGVFFRPGPWYDDLVKPALTPPGWVFSPVWITLYIMIASAGWLVWKKVRSLTHPAVICWGGQLVVNAVWSWLFFGLERPELAFIDITVLLILIACFIRYSYSISRVSSVLFLPYFIWVGFAAYLNLGIVLLN